MQTLPIDKAQGLVEAVTSSPAVHSMHSGRFGEVALLYPKQRVQGLRFGSEQQQDFFEVNIVASYQAGNLYELAQEIRDAAEHVLHGEGIHLPVRVVIADIADDASEPSGTA